MLTTQTSQFGDRAARKAKNVKTVMRNTFQYSDGTDTVFRLHNTDIIRKHADGKVTLNSGGFKTVTTKDRMNSLSDYRVHSERGQWYVTSSMFANKVPFFDGMVLPDAFVKPAAIAAGERTARRDLKLRKQIKAFCDKLDRLDQLPAPSNGDCLYCQLVDRETGKPAFVDHDHLRSHIQEGYMHGSLIIRALQFVGYSKPAFIWDISNRDLKEGLKPVLVKRALRRYLQRSLGLA